MASPSTRKASAAPVQKRFPDRRTLARLPSHYRSVLDEKYLRGLSMNEIAASNGASVEAIESLLRRARASFAREYEQIRTSE